MKHIKFELENTYKTYIIQAKGRQSVLLRSSLKGDKRKGEEYKDGQTTVESLYAGEHQGNIRLETDS